MEHVNENYRQDTYRGLTTPSTAAPTAISHDAQRGGWGTFGVHGLVGLVRAEDS